MNKDKTALLLIDIQNDFCASNGVMAKIGKSMNNIHAAMPNIHHLLNFCRQESILPIFIRTEHGIHTDSQPWKKRLDLSSSDLGICTTEEGQSFFEIQPLEGEPIITKNRYSAFIGTNLDLILRTKGIETIVLCGFTANVCVESTARQGFMMNYRTITLTDCIASYEDHEYESAVYNLKTYFGEVMDSADFIEQIAINLRL